MLSKKIQAIKDFIHSNLIDSGLFKMADHLFIFAGDVTVTSSNFGQFERYYRLSDPPRAQLWCEFFYDAIVFWVAQNVHKTWSEVSTSIGSIFIAVLKSPL